MIGRPEDIFKPEVLSEHDRLLLDLYVECGRSVDELAYTPQFEELYAKLQRAGDTRSKAEVFRRLLAFRKAGRLPRVA